MPLNRHDRSKQNEPLQRQIVRETPRVLLPQTARHMTATRSMINESMRHILGVEPAWSEFDAHGQIRKQLPGEGL